MKVCYHDKFNFDLGILGALHPFDGTKFRKVYSKIKDCSGLEFITPEASIEHSVIDEFVDPLIKRFLGHKEHIIRALEIPKVPFLSYNFIDEKVLTPMRWGVAGTLLSAEEALLSGFCWNLSGGYHHASQHSIEGFCIYNDIGIAYQELLKMKLISASDKILIIDTDAHHGNGNARSFMDNRQVHLLDVYNDDIYPTTLSTRSRVDIPVPLKTGVWGVEYLDAYQKSLEKITDEYALAFVVAGTDVLASDKLGGMMLSKNDVVSRERMTIEALRAKNIPLVVLSGGGYSKESASTIAESLLCLK